MQHLHETEHTMIFKCQATRYTKLNFAAGKLILALLFLLSITASAVPAPVDNSRTSTAYVTGPGDELRLFFMLAGSDSLVPYTAQVGDVFDIIFYMNPELDKTVTVLPDSTIIVPPAAPVRVTGLTPATIADSIKQRFIETLTDPLVVAKPVSIYQTTDKLIKSIGTAATQGLLLTIAPDGMLTLPHCGSVSAGGMQFRDIQDTVSHRYHSKYPGLRVSALLSKSVNNQAFVLGEVKMAGGYDINESPTLLQLVARAQVDLNTSGLSSVLIIRRTTHGDSSEVFAVNLKKMVKKGTNYQNFALRQHDIVFIPKKPISDIGLFVKQYINDLTPQILRIGWTYDLRY